MIINRIGDLRRVAGLRHRFDTEHPTLLDLEVINNKDNKSGSGYKTASGSASNSSSFGQVFCATKGTYFMYNVVNTLIETFCQGFEFSDKKALEYQYVSCC